MADSVLRLCENMRTVVYAPFYFALNRGYFARAGLDVALITSPDPSRTGSTLLNGDADVSWGGPMRVLQHHQADPECPLICFAQVVARDPFLLVGNRPNPGFAFRDLQRCRVAVASDVPTPWLTLQDDLARAGIVPDSIRTLPDRKMADNVAAFLRDEADVVQVLEPWADRLVQTGRGHVWHRFSIRGDIGYSTFYSTRDFVSGKRDACVRLVSGLAAAQADFQADSPTSIAAATAGYFDDLDAASIAGIVAGYRDAGLWAQAPGFPVETFLRLKAALVSGGLLQRDVPYDHVVDAALSSSQPH
ncbi:MAG TPA: ABC transporter substrate-binding protein [Acetobacteraceae bacterium]|nr:ABC transporter substrate-binding protein [Acetobacteraceae bacterium]